MTHALAPHPSGPVSCVCRVSGPMRGRESFPSKTKKTKKKERDSVEICTLGFLIIILVLVAPQARGVGFRFLSYYSTRIVQLLSLTAAKHPRCFVRVRVLLVAGITFDWAEKKNAYFSLTQIKRRTVFIGIQVGSICVL